MIGKIFNVHFKEEKKICFLQWQYESIISFFAIQKTKNKFFDLIDLILLIHTLSQNVELTEKKRLMDQIFRITKEIKEKEEIRKSGSSAIVFMQKKKEEKKKKAT